MCVVTLLNRLRRMNTQRFAQRNGDKRVFRTQRGLLLHKYHVQLLLKVAARRFGFMPEDFTSHSLCVGGASAMNHNGFIVDETQRRGRWVTDVRKIYIRGNPAGEAEMTRRMSEHSTVLHELLKASWA